MEMNRKKISGEVVGGNKLGRQLGYPTANVSVDDAFDAQDGVYAARVSVGGRTYPAMANLGVKPTVSSGGRRTLEVHIFGFEDDLYGRTIDVELVAFVRPEQRFSTFDDLRDALARDRRTVESIFLRGDDPGGDR